MFQRIVNIFKVFWYKIAIALCKVIFAFEFQKLNFNKKNLIFSEKYRVNMYLQRVNSYSHK